MIDFVRIKQGRIEVFLRPVHKIFFSIKSLILSVFYTAWFYLLPLELILSVKNITEKFERLLSKISEKIEFSD